MVCFYYLHVLSSLFSSFFPPCIGLDAEYSRAAADLLLSCLNALADVLDSVKIVPGK